MILKIPLITFQTASYGSQNTIHTLYCLYGLVIYLVPAYLPHRLLRHSSHTCPLSICSTTTLNLFQSHSLSSTNCLPHLHRLGYLKYQVKTWPPESPSLDYSASPLPYCTLLIEYLVPRRQILLFSGEHRDCAFCFQKDPPGLLR